MRLIVIPARLASTRMPNKPLADINGKPLVCHTWAAANVCPNAEALVVTEADEVSKVCKDLDIPCLQTPAGMQFRNGTERVAWVCNQLKPPLDTAIVNWQVDEPQVDPAYVDRLLRNVEEDTGNRVYTLVAPMRDGNVDDANSVKVVHSQGRCHWFSRRFMPGSCYHVGVYAYTWRLLNVLRGYEPTDFSRAASLEQLTWLENGWTICPLEMNYQPLSINTAQDLERYRQWQLATEANAAEHEHVG